jgi:UDP-N-acetylmuramoyl-L-alanyl-D-glutamate--2,6-diaminopimelate ligase
VRLGELAARLPGASLAGDPEVAALSVEHDSRQCGPGSLFVAIRGAVTDGNRFVEAARKRGAVAVASEEPPQTGGSWLRVRDAREALAVLSAAVLGDPSSALELVGVTGTNGKTTTTYLIDAALRAAGHKAGLIGTVSYRIGDRLSEASRTTPEASDLQELFQRMREEACRYAVLEVSSHALALKRVHGCAFRVAVFTNLTRDHLDFHGDMDRYFEAKRLLFGSLLREDGHAILNAADDRSPRLRAASRGRVWTYGIAIPADVRAEELRLTLAGSSFRAMTPLGEARIESPLLGRFNVENLLAALGACLALGLEVDGVARALSGLRGVPGRMERVDAGQDFVVLVDYAHTDDALRNLLETVRALEPRRVITLFGCGGDRDRTKRPLMGAVAARLSDAVVVTSDNPRSEPPEAIIEEILRGLNGGRRAERHVVVDRREAIGRALELAGPGDVVVLAGKGHETYQVLRDRSVPFDDREVAREWLGRGVARGSRA